MKKYNTRCGRCGKRLANPRLPNPGEPGYVVGAKTSGANDPGSQDTDPGVSSSQQRAVDESNQLRANGYARGGPQNIMRSTCPPESAALRYLWGQMRSARFPAGATVAGMDPNDPNFVPDPPSDGDQFIPPDLIMQHNQGCGSMPLDDIKEYFRSGQDTCGGPHGRDYGASYTLPDVYMQDNQGPGMMPVQDIKDYFQTGYDICKCSNPVTAEPDIAANVGAWMRGAKTAHIHASRTGTVVHHPDPYEVLDIIGASHAAAMHKIGEGHGHWPISDWFKHIDEEETKLFPILLHVADTLPAIEALHLRHTIMKLINEHTEVKAKYLSRGMEIPSEVAVPHGKLEDEIIGQYADRILTIWASMRVPRVGRSTRVGADLTGKIDVSAELSIVDKLPALPSLSGLPSIPSIDDIKSTITDAVSSGDSGPLSGIFSAVNSAKGIVSIASSLDGSLGPIVSSLGEVGGALSSVIGKIKDATGSDSGGGSPAPAEVKDKDSWKNAACKDLDVEAELEVIDTMPTVVPSVPGMPAYGEGTGLPNAGALRLIVQGSKDICNTKSLSKVSENMDTAIGALKANGLYVIADKVAAVKYAIDTVIIQVNSASGSGSEKFTLPEAPVEFLAADVKKKLRNPFGTSMDSLKSIKAIATQTVQLTPAEEAARRKAVAEEVARRKAVLAATTKSGTFSLNAKPSETSEGISPVIFLGAAALLGVVVWKFA